MALERSITARSTDPLAAIFIDDEGGEVVRYFVDDQADAPVQPSADALAALAAIGAWSDLDWDELAADLDRIRHESRPTPPPDGEDA
jgi:hypothetical protein